MSVSQEFLRSLLESEEGQKAFKEVFDHVHTQRTERVGSISCPRCRGMRKVDVEVERYPIKDFIAVWNLGLAYGIGKPDDKKKAVAEIPRGKALEDLTNDELELLVEVYEGPDTEEILEAAQAIYEKKGKPLPKSTIGEVYHYNAETGKNERVDKHGVFSGDSVE